jgi:pimeloyl-ACP methyl ester carboxylesterase
MRDNPVIFIHGAGDSARIWSTLPHHLADHPVITIDLPGHGQRPDTLPAQVSIEDYAQAVRAIVREELQVERPFIAGHSMGGAIALTLALQQSLPLAGLILIGTGARLRVRADLLEAARSTPEEAQRAIVNWSLSPATRETLRGALLAEQPAIRPQLYRDLAACNAFDCMGKLEQVRVPTLVIGGADDLMTPVKYSQYLHEHIKGSTLHIIPNAGHYLMREQPAELQRIITAWLATAPSTLSPGSCYNTASEDSY